MPIRVATPLPPLKPQPDRIEMAEEGADRGERRELRLVRPDQPGEQHRGGALGGVEQQGRGGEPLAAGPQHIGRADIARADRAHVAERRRRGSAAARTGSRPAHSRAAGRAAAAARISSGHVHPRALTSQAAQSRATNCGKSDGSALRSPAPRYIGTAMTAPDPSSSSIPASAGCRCCARSARCCRTRRSSTPPTAPAFPTAPRAAAEIAARVPALLGRLAERYDPRLIVIACNTASTIALDAVRAALDLPIVGTVPAIKPAAALSKTPRDRRARHRRDHRPALCRPARRRVRRRLHWSSATARPSWSSWPRRSCAAKPTDPAAYARILDGLLARPGGERIDTIVLACTHFPLVEAELAAAAPRPIAFVDGKRGDRPPHRLAGPRPAWPDGARRRRRGLHRAARTSRPIAPASPRFGLTRIEPPVSSTRAFRPCEGGFRY